MDIKNLWKESLNSGGQQFHQYQHYHLSPKESLNSDGQQFHQYQHYHLSPQTLNTYIFYWLQYYWMM